MSVEVNVAETEFMGDKLTFFDCPGSIEFAFEGEGVLAGVDLAVVVAEADEKKIPALQVILKTLEDHGVPRILFLNKVDKADASVRETLKTLQPASGVPLVLRHIPIWKDGIVTGYIDLALERAFVYHDHAPSEMIPITDEDKAREVDARYHMLETLADYDDELMEQLLEDIEPPRDQIFDDLVKEMRDGLICPVLIGAAEHGDGVGRLLKAIRHEAPDIADTAHAARHRAERRRHRAGDEDRRTPPMAASCRSPGCSPARSATAPNWSARTARSAASPASSASWASTRPSAMRPRPARRSGSASSTAPQTGMTLGTGKTAPPQVVTLDAARAGARHGGRRGRAQGRRQAVGGARQAGRGRSVAARHPHPGHRRDAARRAGRDASARGDGAAHRQVRHRHRHPRAGGALQGDDPRARSACAAATRSSPAATASSAMWCSRSSRCRAAPASSSPRRSPAAPCRGTISARSRPGVTEYLSKGPLGFPVVDVSVTLTDGSYHAVDSSDMAFRTAAQIGMREGMPQCSPVLLEPILKVEIAVPSEATPRVNGIVSQRRGQILGFDARPGWPGWDVVEALIPQAEIRDLIVELRSATAGVGTFKSASTTWPS